MFYLLKHSLHVIVMVTQVSLMVANSLLVAIPFSSALDLCVSLCLLPVSLTASSAWWACAWPRATWLAPWLCSATSWPRRFPLPLPSLPWPPASSVAPACLCCAACSFIPSSTTCHSGGPAPVRLTHSALTAPIATDVLLVFENSEEESLQIHCDSALVAQLHIIYRCWFPFALPYCMSCTIRCSRI